MRKNKGFLLFIVIIILSACFSGCGKAVEERGAGKHKSVVVTTSVNQTEINIGDKIKYTIIVKSDSGIEIKIGRAHV